VLPEAGGTVFDGLEEGEVIELPPGDPVHIFKYCVKYGLVILCVVSGRSREERGEICGEGEGSEKQAAIEMRFFHILAADV